MVETYFFLVIVKNLFGNFQTRMHGNRDTEHTTWGDSLIKKAFKILERTKK